MGIGTFGTFTQARLGIYAATKGLTVTGNNISNINTVGYTRQALDQVSLRNGGADRYQSKYDVRIGNGALIRSVSQLRDPYLDIRYRTEASVVGHTNQMLEGLTSIADVIDEVGKGDNKGDGVMYAQFSDLLSSLEMLNTDAAAQSNDTLTRTSADSLTNLFHFYADKLEKLEKDTGDRLKQELEGLNGILTSIRDLNSAIRKSDIHGDPALEMRDERNNLIDKLSEYVKVDVIYTMEDVGAGQQVEKLTIKLGDANPDPAVDTDSTVLVDGIYARQFEMPESFPTENEDYDPTYVPGNPIDPTTDLAYFKYLKADGTGTNDPAEAEQIPNSNYDMSLTKLLDAKGRQWSNILSSSVTKMNPPPAGAPVKAVYAFTLGGDLQWSTDPDNPSKITIDGTEYTIGGTGEHAIGTGIAGNVNRLASFIANELSKGAKYADYEITAQGANILFTARTAGAVGAGNSGPAEAVNLQLANGGATLTLTPDATNTVAGAEGDPTQFNPVSLTSNPDGTKTITTYTMKGTDWYKTEIVNEYSSEVELDDNDLYGAIQAFREILTESGEFSTADTVNNIDENATIKRGIPYYRHSLDLLARVFAEAFNEANNGYAVDHNGNYLTKDGEVLTLNGEAVVKDKELTADQQTELDARALTDFIKANLADVSDDGNATLLDENGETLSLGGEPVLAENLTLTMTDGTTQNLKDALTNAIGVNQDGNFVDQGGNVVLDLSQVQKVEANAATPLTAQQQKALDEQALDNFLTVAGEPLGGNLFSNRGDLDDAEGITAANISISRSWANGDIHIVNTFTKLFGGDVANTTQDNNIGHMISLMSQKLVYVPADLVEGSDSNHLFQGSFQDMLINMCSVLGNDQLEVEGTLNNSATYAVEMDTNRDSVSAVDLNDEAMNLMQYAKSLNAAYRLMTTLDEALDRLINNTGIVGR